MKAYNICFQKQFKFLKYFKNYPSYEEFSQGPFGIIIHHTSA